jgi:EAL domain-containing protein (putative c-di-GMP-specific phosphodiesterase class I)
LEITEGFLIKNTEFIISVLKELSSMGVSISIDDFGSGYSSLGRLKELPVNILKIDKIFIDDVDRDSNNTSILTAIIQLAHSIGLKVIAEGVETIKELEILKAMDCDEVQGYLISRPLSDVDMEKLIKSFTLTNYTLI